MPPKSKSIFRQPGAKHFQLVHRSQRDPLIHDPEASQHVLKPVERENAKKGKSRADLDSTLSDQVRPGVGEAALYGIYYDDTEYDYMQHLKPVGVQEDGVESMWVEAPTKMKKRGESKGIELKDLPAEALPSASELPRTYESQQAIPESISGFQPDMDPHLRQTLEALDDDAFVDDDLGDDFFAELVKDGERYLDEEIDFEFREDGLENEGEASEADGLEDWEKRFAKFKLEQPIDAESDDELYSDDGDTVGELPSMRVIGAKKRRKGSSIASGYSMSSSSMYRNEALQTLDERFDQMISKEYNDKEGEPSESEGDDSDEAPDLIPAREDFGAMVNEFLDEYEVVGRKLKPKLEGDTGVDKLDTIRRALGQDERIHLSLNNHSSKEEEILMPADIDEHKERWDCETILSTYTNLENHPRIIRLRNSKKPIAKIHLDPKTSLPIVEPRPIQKAEMVQNSKSDTESDTEELATKHATITRPRDESKEAKKARKAALKAERQTRRANKKAMKEQFSSEYKAQTKIINSREPAGLKNL
ncbi:hypothetical protein AX16_000447 [Volvariella volvacea WC 439]|nr:hypothetical protein AX16_000447 [Volvariella volvacea WC 439]